MKKYTIGVEDRLKAIRKGSREAEFETMGPGFHSKNKIVKSKKAYRRKQKHNQRGRT